MNSGNKIKGAGELGKADGKADEVIPAPILTKDNVL